MGKMVWRFHEWDKKMRRKQIKEEVEEVGKIFNERLRKEVKEEFEKNGWDTGNL